MIKRILWIISRKNEEIEVERRGKRFGRVGGQHGPCPRWWGIDRTIFRLGLFYVTRDAGKDPGRKIALIIPMRWRRQVRNARLGDFSWNRFLQ
uniref:Uncharacterized protein n=1 Tax=Candidatus Kentrum sp. SD TaxID=2126332 RepID=A0A450YD12_9GAMM|nr:MAG: hypothetical protein BECKSD772F_GA0070984_103817 [Candidatus Kentron sp. SD]VFK41089.1 MAG: hypothetical protein BECKSD772E_GA0070983_100934 [Candidatus Kentron sp. SD]VFK78878.1 MAG: hypothetical protein BECKSD772D_GA0070982_102816 [Candidatus Kentron sp. SD]